MVIVLNIGHALVDRAVARPWEDPEDLEARPRGLNSLIIRHVERTSSAMC